MSVVKHLEQFPGDGLTTALRNVFDFDFHHHEDLNLIAKILSRHGVAIQNELTAYQGTVRSMAHLSVHLGKVLKLAPTIRLQPWIRQAHQNNGRETTLQSFWTQVPLLKNKRTKMSAFTVNREVRLTPLAAKDRENESFRWQQ